MPTDRLAWEIMVNEAAHCRQDAIFFIIPGKPFGKQRPRFSRRSGRAFTPKETVSFEQTVGTLAAKHFPQPLVGAVRIDIVAVFEIPASWSNRKREAHLGQPHTQRPDLDNIGKAVCDGLNRIAFADDAQIADIHISKQWGEQAHTAVRVVLL